MARVSTYLNFLGKTEEAFDFYREVFGTEYLGPIMRIGDAASQPGAPELSESDRNLVMHVALPITGGHVLMGTDFVESMGHELRVGNAVSLHLELDSLDEAERIFGMLAQGGEDVTPIAQMPWGAYWGNCLDRFGTRWMFSAPMAG